MQKFKLAIGIHNHQPVGNFDSVFEEAHNQAYMPFLKLFDKFDNIIWKGHLPLSLMAEYLTGCDLGIMPYLPMDSFYFSPLKLYDMIGACLPSIGCSIGQIAEVYEEYPEAGWDVKNGNVREYIELIRHLQQNKSEVKIKKKHLINSRMNHTWKIRVENLIDSIEPILKKKKRCFKI